MSDVPETRFARSADDVRLAYQVSGAGPLNVLFMRDEPIPVDLIWDDPWFVRLSKRLGAFSRTVWGDSPGVGASEGDWHSILGEHRGVADVLAVVDAAVDCDPVALVGWGAQGMTAIQFSVTHPERVSALALVNSFAHYVREDGYPWGIPRASLDRLAAALQEGLDTGAILELLAPSRAGDDRFRAWWSRAQRLGVVAGAFGELARASVERDVRPLLASVSVPTLVLHREEDRFVRLGAGRYLAEHIPGARFVVLPGADHAPFAGDVDAVVDEIEEFLTGARSGAEGDVVTATVLFTDIVGSTEHQARVGAGEWSRLTDQHDAMIRTALNRHRAMQERLGAMDQPLRATDPACETYASPTPAGGPGCERTRGM